MEEDHKDILINVLKDQVVRGCLLLQQQNELISKQRLELAEHRPSQSSGGTTLDPAIELSIYKHQRDDLMRWYKELRQLYYDRTGIDYQPTELVMDKVAPTENDREWLRSIGIKI